MCFYDKLIEHPVDVYYQGSATGFHQVLMEHQKHNAEL